MDLRRPGAQIVDVDEAGGRLPDARHEELTCCGFSTNVASNRCSNATSITGLANVREMPTAIRSVQPVF